MRILHYLIVIPLVAAAVWVIYNADSSAEGIFFAPWPQDCVDTKLVLTAFLVFGYVVGRIGAWFGYSPLRRELRKEKKANRVLNKEQLKLNETVSGLKLDIAGLQEKARLNAVNNAANSEQKNEIKDWWNGFKQKITPKKGN